MSKCMFCRDTGYCIEPNPNGGGNINVKCYNLPSCRSARRPGRKSKNDRFRARKRTA